MKTNPDVREFVEREMDAAEGQGLKPREYNQALYDGAVKIDPSIAEMSLRSFYAKYPLQIKKARTAARKRAELEAAGAAAPKARRARKPRKAPATGKAPATVADDPDAAYPDRPRKAPAKVAAAVSSGDAGALAIAERIARAAMESGRAVTIAVIEVAK